MASTPKTTDPTFTSTGLKSPMLPGGKEVGNNPKAPQPMKGGGKAPAGFTGGGVMPGKV